jgi:uncharacterized protein
LILYVDTSWLSKIYLDEVDSLEVRSAVRLAARLVSSRIAYAEGRVALARARRSGRMDDAVFRAARAEFERGWQSMLVVELSEDVAREAGDLGDRHAIRGFDAVHLASAKTFRAAATSEVSFMTADRRLRDAAVAEGFGV